MNLFKCAYCLINKDLKEQGGEINKNKEKLKLKQEIWEEELAKVKEAQIQTSNREKKGELQQIIDRTIKELENVDFLLKNSQEKICRTCWRRFEKKNIEVFKCAICKLEITGEKLGGHVANYQDEGVSVRRWVNFCRPCRETRIIEANIYCPRKGEGRDDEWDTDRPLFDCDCSVSEDKQII